MNSNFWVSIVSLVGSLVLVGAGLRSRRISARRTLVMGGVWVAIIIVVAMVMAGAQRA